MLNVIKYQITTLKGNKTDYQIIHIKHLFIFSLEYIDYHLSSESSITQTKTYPQILSRFDMNEDHPLNVTAQIASTITLHCVIRNLNNKTVRKRLDMFLLQQQLLS